jgi:hypothetical protein
MRLSCPLVSIFRSPRSTREEKLGCGRGLHELEGSPSSPFFDATDDGSDGLRGGTDVGGRSRSGGLGVERRAGIERSRWVLTRVAHYAGAELLLALDPHAAKIIKLNRCALRGDLIFFSRIFASRWKHGWTPASWHALAPCLA